jgi:RNA polymerase sigma-70 factor (ECF subfamily)
LEQETSAADFMARLRAYVQKRVASPADIDDIVQTVVLRLLEKDAASDATPPAAWMLSTARSVIVDFYRARARSGASLEAEPPDVALAQDASDIVRCLVPLMQALDQDERELLERVDMRSESQTLLAERAGISVTGMKSRVQRARLRLRELVSRRCEVERDAFGAPTGPASCKTGTTESGCGCADASPASEVGREDAGPC